MTEQQPAQGWGSTTTSVTGPAPGVFYATPGSRLIAQIVDGLVCLIAGWGLILVVGLILGGAAAVVTYGLVVLVSLGYFPYFWTHGGASPGMKAFKIRVVNQRDGSPVTIGTAIIRLIGYYISAFVFFLGYIWILFDRDRQGWHDKLAGTVVIQNS